METSVLPRALKAIPALQLGCRRSPGQSAMLLAERCTSFWLPRGNPDFKRTPQPNQQVFRSPRECLLGNCKPPAIERKTCHAHVDMLQCRCQIGHSKLSAQLPRLPFKRSDHNLSQQKTVALGRCRAAASDDASISSSGVPSPSGRTDEAPAGVLGWLKRSFGSRKLDKQKLAEYGLGAFAAYGIVSNLNAGVLVTIAWLTVVKQTGLTPIDPGQWPKFLAVYAGLYLTTNLLRPVRLTLALTIAPFFNKGLEGIQRVLRCNKAVAFGVMLAGIAVTSFTCISLAIVLCGGFPNGLPPAPRMPWANA